MIINLVVAASENNAIGRDNKLLWRLPNDLAFFKNTTWGMPVIMGRKTYESMGKPLKGRTNIVISHQASKNLRAPSEVQNYIVTVPTIQDAIKAAAETDAKECYVIGGGEIYRLFLPIAHRIYFTRVHADLEGDTFFPAFDKKEWNVMNSTTFSPDDKHKYAYTFEIWERNTSLK